MVGFNGDGMRLLGMWFQTCTVRCPTCVRAGLFFPLFSCPAVSRVPRGRQAILISPAPVVREAIVVPVREEPAAEVETKGNPVDVAGTQPASAAGVRMRGDCCS